MRRIYLSTVYAHEQITWSAIVVNPSVMSEDFMNAIVIEDISQTLVQCLLLEDNALTQDDQVEE